jgi:hypothetical protein
MYIRPSQKHMKERVIYGDLRARAAWVAWHDPDQVSRHVLEAALKPSLWVQWDFALPKLRILCPHREERRLGRL